MNGTIWGREPALIIAVVTAVIEALAVFGVLNVTEDQMKALLAVVVAIVPLIAGGATRSQVYAPETVRRIERAAHAG